MKNETKCLELLKELFEIYRAADIEKRLEVITRLAVSSEELNAEPNERSNIISFKTDLSNFFKSVEPLVKNKI